MNSTLDAVSKVASPIIAVAALAVSIVGTRNAVRIARQALAKADREEQKELARLLCETQEMEKSVGFLDLWIWDRHVFTRSQEILAALSAIKDYWKRNDESLRHFLGTTSRTYKGVKGLYDVALQNEDNQPTPEGHGVWRGLTQENQQGFKVGQLFFYVANELEQRRG